MIELKYKKELYSKVSLIKSAYNFTDKAYIHLDSDDDYYYVLHESKYGEGINDIRQTFENEMLAQSGKVVIMFGSNDTGFFGVHDGGSSRFDRDHDGKLDWLEEHERRAYDYEEYTRQNKMMRGDYDVDSLLDVTDDGLGVSGYELDDDDIEDDLDDEDLDGIDDDFEDDDDSDEDFDDDDFDDDGDDL